MKKIVFPILLAFNLCSCTQTEYIEENEDNSTAIIDTTILVDEEKYKLQLK